MRPPADFGDERAYGGLRAQSMDPYVGVRHSSAERPLSVRWNSTAESQELISGGKWSS